MSMCTDSNNIEQDLAAGPKAQKSQLLQTINIMSCSCYGAKHYTFSFLAFDIGVAVILMSLVMTDIWTKIKTNHVTFTG